jgi:hypothetical protein
MIFNKRETLKRGVFMVPNEAKYSLTENAISQWIQFAEKRLRTESHSAGVLE